MAGTFEEMEALAFDEAAVNEAKKKAASPLACGCPGTMAKTISRKAVAEDEAVQRKSPSRLTQWPVQIKLVAPNTPYFRGADLLVAADCTAYAYGSFRDDFIKGRVCVVGGSKLDMVDYADKLEAILEGNDVRSVTGCADGSALLRRD